MACLSSSSANLVARGAQGLEVHESGKGRGEEWGGFQSPSLVPGVCLGILLIGQDPQPPVRQVLGPASTQGHLLTDLPSLAALVPLASSPDVCSGAISPWLPVSLPCVSPCLTALGSCLRPPGSPPYESGRWLRRELAEGWGLLLINIHHHLITIR